MEFIPVDPDVHELSLRDLRQWYMRRRLEAKQAINNLNTNGQDSCLDEIVQVSLNLLPDQTDNNASP